MKFRAMVAVLGLLCGGLVAAGSAGAQVPRCFGEPATIVVSAPGVTTRGTSGPDVIVGTSGDDRILGLGGNDRICGLGGDDTILGGKGKDRIKAGAGADKVKAGSGADIVRGGSGPDVLSGGKGPDKLWGNKGPDTLRGNGGNDRLLGGAGADTCTGGKGNDTLKSCRAGSAPDPDPSGAWLPFPEARDLCQDALGLWARYGSLNGGFYDVYEVSSGPDAAALGADIVFWGLASFDHPGYWAFDAAGNQIAADLGERRADWAVRLDGEKSPATCQLDVLILGDAPACRSTRNDSTAVVTGVEASAPAFAAPSSSSNQLTRLPLGLPVTLTGEEAPGLWFEVKVPAQARWDGTGCVWVQRGFLDLG